MIELFIFNLLFIWGVYSTFQKRMILHKVGIWLGLADKEPILPEFICKPLGACPICMPSIYGSLFFWISYILGFIIIDYVFLIYICYVFALSGANYLILMFMPE